MGRSHFGSTGLPPGNPAPRPTLLLPCLFALASAAARTWRTSAASAASRPCWRPCSAAASLAAAAARRQVRQPRARRRRRRTEPWTTCCSLRTRREMPPCLAGVWGIVGEAVSWAWLWAAQRSSAGPCRQPAWPGHATHAVESGSAGDGAGTGTWALAAKTTKRAMRRGAAACGACCWATCRAGTGACRTSWAAIERGAPLSICRPSRRSGSAAALAMGAGMPVLHSRSLFSVPSTVGVTDLVT